MKRLVVLLGAAILLAGACSDDGGVPEGASPSASPTETPAIVVNHPRPGDRVSSPVAISGDADVFEATVSIRILDASGAVIAEDFTTATCGTGCRGTYSKEVAFDVSSEQAGTIEVFESSAEDGSQLFLVSIPVTLLP
ncbi:MAG: Gmad2 immunoglobulin-like domain-containing protein [Actinomycetota bacterium]